MQAQQFFVANMNIKEASSNSGTESSSASSNSQIVRQDTDIPDASHSKATEMLVDGKNDISSILQDD